MKATGEKEKQRTPSNNGS